MSLAHLRLVGDVPVPGACSSSKTSRGRPHWPHSVAHLQTQNGIGCCEGGRGFLRELVGAERRGFLSDPRQEIWSGSESGPRQPPGPSGTWQRQFSGVLSGGVVAASERSLRPACPVPNRRGAQPREGIGDPWGAGAGDADQPGGSKSEAGRVRLYFQHFPHVGGSMKDRSWPFFPAWEPALPP